MQRVATQITNGLVFSSKRSFSNMLRDSVSNPIKERVMSTPAWPVPYYQRIHKAYPIRGNCTDMQRKSRSTYQWMIIVRMILTGIMLRKT